METYFTLKEKFANYLFFTIGEGGRVCSMLQLNYEDTKRIIRGRHSKDAHNGNRKKTQRQKQ